MDLNCSARYEQGEINVDPVPTSERYPSHIFLAKFMPGTLMLVRVLMLTWLISGLFGNTLSFCIWSTKYQRRKSTSSIYLAALALADFILILALMDYHAERYWGYQGITAIGALCQAYQCITIFAQYYSTTLVFGFTLERYLAVCFPFKRHKLCSARRAVLAVTILMLICMVPTIFQAVLWTFEDGVCHMKIEWIRDSRVQGVLTGQEIVFSLVVPLAALVLNLLLLKEIRRLVRSTAVPSSARSSQVNGGNMLNRLGKSSALTNSSSTTMEADSEATVGTRESSSFITTTIMLAILSFYLIACAVPPGVVYLAQFMWAQPDDCLSEQAIHEDPQWDTFLRQLNSKEVIDVLCASHYALNFFIYLLTSTTFRDHARWILTCKVDKLKRLSKPRRKSWIFPRRTGPRVLSNKANEIEKLMETNGR